jgi:hypothetical protein
VKDRSRRVGLALLVAIGLLTTSAWVTGCAAQQTRPPEAEELLVGFVSGTTSAQAAAIYTPLGATLLEQMPAIGVHRIRVTPGSIESVERALKANPSVRFVERNRQVRTN